MVPHNINFSKYVVVAVITLAAISIQSIARDLRPSDHGLSYEEDSFPPAHGLSYEEDSFPPAQSDDVQEMRSFFGTTSSNFPKPEAQSINDTWFNVHGESGSGDDRRDHLRMGLLLASAVCGLTGVVLLFVSGIIFLVRYHRRNIKGERISYMSAPITLPNALISDNKQ